MRKGSKHSEETRKKIGEKAKERHKIKENHPMYGKKHSEETKKKMSEAMRGIKRKPFTEETKKKMSEAMKGEKNPMYGVKRCFTDEWKSNLSEALSGENNPNWKGGISCEPYCDVWLDKEYKESIKERDNYTCQNPLCLCDSSKLVIHHINYVKKDCVPNNLITVCNSSNSRANKDRWVWQDIYERVIGEV